MKTKDTVRERFDKFWDENINENGVDAVWSFMQQIRKEWAQEVLGLAEDHYWDSLSEEKGLVIKHLKGILDKLKND